MKPKLLLNHSIASKLAVCRHGVTYGPFRLRTQPERFADRVRKLIE